jgi:hypothetical protein
VLTDTNHTVLFTPSVPLAQGATYTVSASGQVSNGNVQQVPVSFSFTTVTVVTVESMINDLIGDVEGLREAGRLNTGQANALVKKLQGALQKYNAGQPSVAVNRLNAFINQVDSFVSSGVLTPAEGQALTGEAQMIIDAINNGS